MVSINPRPLSALELVGCQNILCLNIKKRHGTLVSIIVSQICGTQRLSHARQFGYCPKYQTETLLSALESLALGLIIGSLVDSSGDTCNKN